MIVQRLTAFLIVAAFVLVAFGTLLVGTARAESFFESLVMPGDLAEAHAKLQDTCANCHTSFSQGAQPDLCLACHKTVDADIKADRGFHGRSAEARSLACSECHNDHQGRDFAMIALDPETFDHAQSDFALKGAHAKADCSDCHLPGKKFAQAPGLCIDCHQKNDTHKGALGTDCARCHVETRWSEVAAFDHATTRFALFGAHKQQDCASCHGAQVWKGLPLDCVGCHQIDDVHKGRFGAICATCHDSAKWAEVKFQHDTDTDFDLLGKHKALDCAACHATGQNPAKTATECAACHRLRDVHQGTLGADCASCHGVDGWRIAVRFDHDLTGLPLIGLHAVVPCEGCHLNKMFGTAELACASCHLPDDVHKAALGPDCATCHTPNGWVFWRFDHDAQTDFDLTGAHNGLKCEACHSPGTKAAAVPVQCATCHARQDVHKGGFGADCAACHSTASFKGAKLNTAPAPTP